MALRDLIPWQRSRGSEVSVRRFDHPVAELQSDVNRLFDELWSAFDRGFWPAGLGRGLPGLGGEFGGFRPQVDVVENEREILVTAELPGLEEKDFELRLENDLLVIRGEKHQERESARDGWTERSYGRFERAIPLPVEVEAEKISARFENGILTVTLPKSEAARSRGRAIPVSAS